MKNTLAQAIHSIDNSVNAIKNKSYLGRNTPVSKHGNRRVNVS